ncbi:MAG: PaaI family thioesterase [Spirochaetes bacterium]|jgi:acyl-CoA thioesterase|nr:PaaI family thioesterase [Spirochaetota bacterium]
MDHYLTSNTKNDRFARLVGIELVEVNLGSAVAKLELNDNHLNGVNIVQGGVIFTLADFAFAAASNSEGFPTVGLNVNITYYKSPTGSVITAEAREIKALRKVSGYNVDVLDEDGSLVAVFSGLGYRLSKK